MHVFFLFVCFDFRLFKILLLLFCFTFLFVSLFLLVCCLFLCWFFFSFLFSIIIFVSFFFSFRFFFFFFFLVINYISPMTRKDMVYLKNKHSISFSCILSLTHLTFFFLYLQWFLFDNRLQISNPVNFSQKTATHWTFCLTFKAITLKKLRHLLILKWLFLG